MEGMAGRYGTMREGEEQSCYFNPSTEAETGMITSSYIENAGFPTNQERSINDNYSFNASSFSNHSPAVNLDASKLRIPMIEESRDILLSDIKNSTSSTNRERSINSSTFNNDLIQSRLKGLPDGWVTEIRCSGLGNSTFKVYIDPKSGYEFRSLMDAHRYILTEDICHCVIKPKRRKSLEPQTEGRELHQNHHGVWLPAGWVVNIRTQNGGKCHGVKKKSYYNPSTGLRFYSKVKLFQHLDAQKALIPAIRETSSVKTSCFNDASSPTNHQQSQINNTFNVVLTGVSSKSLPNTWRTEMTNSQKGAPEYQVPSSIRFERENCGSNRCHFSDNSPDYAKIMADMRESVSSSSLPSQGIAVDNSSCTSSYPNCLVGENAEEIRLVNELSQACLVGATPIQAINLGEEWPLNLETEDLYQSVSSMVYDTVNEPQKTMQQFSQLVNDEWLFEIPVQMPQVHMTAPELAHSPSLRRQNENLSSLYGNLANERNFEMSGEVSRPIKHINELGSTTSMVVEAIKKQHQASKQAAALKCYQMMYYGGEEQSHEAKTNAFCQLQAETASILNQPARSNLATGSFYRQKDAPFVDHVQPYEIANMQVSTEPNAEQGKGVAILDHPAQSNLFTGSFYQKDGAPFVEPALTCELQRNTQSHEEFSSEQAQLARCDSENQYSPRAFAFDNSWSDPYFNYTFNIFTSDAQDFDDTDKLVQYFEQLEEQTTSKN